MGLLRSRAFITVVAAVSIPTSIIACDRYRASRLLRAYNTEAEALGAQPLPDGHEPRRITLMLYGGDVRIIRGEKERFKTYVVKLLTKAGVEYDWMEINAEKFERAALEMAAAENKMLDKETDVIDREKGKDEQPHNIYASPTNTIRHYVGKWMYLVNGNTQFRDSVPPSAAPLPALAAAQSKFYAVPTRGRLALTDGLVALDQEALVAASEGVADWWQREPDSRVPSTGLLESLFRPSFGVKDPITPNLGYIPCEMAVGWRHRLYEFFNSTNTVKRIGEATLQILHSQPSVVPLQTFLPGSQIAGHLGNYHPAAAK